MIVTVERSGWHSGGWKVRLTQGVQSFDLRYDGGKAECTFVARLLRRAIDAHDAERDAAKARAGTER